MLFECHYLFQRKFCVTSHGARLESFVEHVFGGSYQAFNNALFHAFLLGILNRGVVIIQIFHIRLIVTKFNFVKIRNCLNPDLRDSRIFRIVENDAGESGKSFNRDNRGLGRREAA